MDAPERWLRLDVPAPRAGKDAAHRRRALVEALVALGGSGVEEDGDRLRTFVAPPDDAEGFLEDVRERLAEAVGRPLEVEARWVEARDWGRAWRRGLEPRRVGERIVVAPSWSDPEARPGDVVVRIDPGMAFGTGEHGTTRGALRLLAPAVGPGARVLDVGTGSGVLAVAAALLGADSVLALDRDDEAVRTAAGNLERNGVADRVDLLRLEVGPGSLRLLAPPPFDVVAANILASVLLPLLEPMRFVASDEGRLILGGILAGEEGEVLEAARSAGWSPEDDVVDEGWWTGLFRAAAG